LITPILFRIKGEPPPQLSTTGGTPSVNREEPLDFTPLGREAKVAAEPDDDLPF